MKHPDPYKYLKYDENDRVYFGCPEVIQAELKYIRERRKSQGLESQTRERETAPRDLTGVALSGGGIRSASYCLGVLQALAFGGWLKKFDYLSTVSGGGYIGGALTWFLHRKWHGPSGEAIAFGLERTSFPFGAYPMVSMWKDDLKETAYKGRLLAQLRQHANYLAPGDGVNLFSLLAVALRNTLFSLVVYGGLLALAFVLVKPLLYDTTWTVVGYRVVRGQQAWLPHCKSTNMTIAQWLMVLLPLVFAGAIVVYAAITFLLPRAISTGYTLRRFYERWLGYLLALLVGALIVNAVPYADCWIDEGLKTTSLKALGKGLTTAFGAVSTIVGGASSLWAFFDAGKEKPKLPVAVPVALGCFASIFGLLLIGFSAASAWSPGELWGAIWHPTSLVVPLTLLAFLIFLALPNLNYLSLHRYYRDRLMETFTPDLPDAIDVNGPVPGASKSADSTQLHKMLSDEPLGPYPLINANIVLVSSHIPKFRGRGGDNFILTPMYCGSNATGWCKTTDKKSPFEDLTLPTAIAISGAALNSNTGSGGEGLTRAPWLAFLMGFFSIRLGYWVANPTPKRERLKRIADELERKVGTAPVRGDQPAYSYGAEVVAYWIRVAGLWPLRRARMLVHHLLSFRLWALRGPSPLHPGLSELFLRKNLDENSRFVQLSDGGHFENLGLYELIRRKLKLIVVCDATADPHFAFEDLSNAIEKVRADFGALIDLDADRLKTVIPVKKAHSAAQEHAVAFSKRGYLTGRITYSDSKSTGTLLYLNTTLFNTISADLYGYRRAHPSFPDQPTSDQFFDEKEFESYRELGYQTAFAMLRDPEVTSLPDVQTTLGPPAV